MKLLFFILSISTILFGHDAPYSIKHFQDILNNTKLQAPTSHFDPKWSRDYGEFQYYENKYFYLQDNKYMTFLMCGKKNRSELREKETWKVSTQKAKILFAEIAFFSLNAKREFTFLQIHADPNYKNNLKHNSINKPLLRIVWKKQYRNLKNHIWAVIRTSALLEEHKYIKIDLGKYKNNFFTVKIVVKTSRLVIYINNTRKVDLSVSYWDNIWNYFKAGVYLQDNGCAKILFKQLRIEGQQ